MVIRTLSDFQVCLFGQVEVVRFLLESGDDQNVLGDLGATPLHIAAERGHLETWMMHRYLMDRGSKSSFFQDVH